MSNLLQLQAINKADLPNFYYKIFIKTNYDKNQLYQLH